MERQGNENHKVLGTNDFIYKKMVLVHMYYQTAQNKNPYIKYARMKK